MSQQKLSTKDASELQPEKSPEQIKAEYRASRRTQIVASFGLSGFALLVPTILSVNSFTGIDRSIWFAIIPAVVLAGIWIGFGADVCPKCGSSPGGGWDRYNCKWCGVELRD